MGRKEKKGEGAMKRKVSEFNRMHFLQHILMNVLIAHILYQNYLIKNSTSTAVPSTKVALHLKTFT